MTSAQARAAVVDSSGRARLTAQLLQAINTWRRVYRVAALILVVCGPLLVLARALPEGVRAMGAFIVVFAAFVSGLIVSAYHAQRLHWGPEVRRKLAHVMAGAMLAGLPFITGSAWPTYAAALLLLGFSMIIRFSPRRRAMYGRLIYGIDRQQSLGEFFLPMGLAAQFWFSGGDALLFIVPCEIVIVADAAAALVGQRFPIYRPLSGISSRSIGGSLAFFTSAVVVAFPVIMVWAGLSIGPAVRLSAALSAVATAVEFVSIRGSDNLTIPLVSGLMLEGLLSAGSAGP